jgi:hypothetical protein
MFKCNTLIINNNKESLDFPWLNIGGTEITVNKNGDIKTKDEDGNEKEIKKIKKSRIEVGNVTQLITSYTTPHDIYIDNNSMGSNCDDIIEIVDNSMKFKESGVYFIIYNITLDNEINNRRTTSKALLKLKKTNDFEILNDSFSYGYHRTVAQGIDTLVSSSIYEIEKDNCLKLCVQIDNKSGNNCKLTTMPYGTKIDIIKIG